MKWISVKTALPEKNKRVLTVSDVGLVEIGKWFYESTDEGPDKPVWVNDSCCGEYIEVTRWMELPEPTKE